MKTFLYLLTSIRNGAKDNQVVVSGTLYYHYQLLAVIEASDAEHAAQAMNVKIVNQFDRSSSGYPTIYYTSSYYKTEDRQSSDHKEGYFFLSLKEIEDSDRKRYPELNEKFRLKVTAPIWE